VGFCTAAILLERNLIEIKALYSPIFALLLSVSIFITIFTILFQSAAIRHVRPEKASIIYTFEPVAALLLGVVLLGERLQGIKQLFGCLLILAAVFISLYKRSEWRKQPGDSIKQPVLLENAMER
jgi:drug/metabolite transporter (DMT)-like permease